MITFGVILIIFFILTLAFIVFNNAGLLVKILLLVVCGTPLIISGTICAWTTIQVVGGTSQNTLLDTINIGVTGSCFVLIAGFIKWCLDT